MIRVLIVDDHMIIRRGLRQILAQGRTVGDIAQQLSLSANTISTYRARICEKLGLRNALEIAHYAARHQLLGA